jgi:molecular chaperone GrpE (heat shock protein)
VPENPVPDASWNGLEVLSAAVALLRQDVLAALEKSDRSGSIISSLEAENRALRQRENERKQEPMIKSVISLFDDLRSVSRHARSQAASNGGPPLEFMESLLVFEQQAREALRRGYVEAFEPTVGEPFDPRTQEVGATVKANYPTQEMKIVEVLRLGFEFGGRVIRPAAVTIYRFQDRTA